MSDLKIRPLLLVVAVTALGGLFLGWVYGLVATGIVGVTATATFAVFVVLVLAAVTLVLTDRNENPA